jgi:hypothetical protein
MNIQKRPVGAPRTLSPPPEDMIVFGEEMIEWIKSNKPLHIKEFYARYKGLSRNTWQGLIKLKEFVGYYELGLDLISTNYIDGTINPSISHRFIRHYFKEIKEEETEQKEEDHQYQKKLAEFIHTMRKEMTETVSEDVKAQFESLMNQITNMKRK